MISENAIGVFRDDGPIASCGLTTTPTTALVTLVMSRNCAVATALALRLLTEKPR